MNLRARAALPALLLAGFLLTACGGVEEAAGGNDRQYVEAVASAWDRADDTKVSEAQARCWGEKLVDRLGVDRVSTVGAPVEFGRRTVDLDLVELNLSQAEAQEIYDDFASCGGNLSHDTDQLFGELGLPDELDECIATSLDGEVMEDFFVTALQEGKEQAAAGLSGEGLESALSACVAEVDPSLLGDIDAG